MKNRAKCKLCNSIIESFHRHDYVKCACGEIAVDGGKDYFKCSAKNFQNFVRIDDNDNEVPVKVVDEEKQEVVLDEPSPPTRDELIEMLDTMAKNIQGLPQHAMTLPVTHYDLYSALVLLSALLKLPALHPPKHE